MLARLTRKEWNSKGFTVKKDATKHSEFIGWNSFRKNGIKWNVKEYINRYDAKDVKVRPKVLNRLLKLAGWKKPVEFTLAEAAMLHDRLCDLNFEKESEILKILLEN